MDVPPEPVSAQSEPNSQDGQAGPAANKPTIEEIRSLEGTELLAWILKKLPKLFDEKDVENFRKAKIDGDIFLENAGNTNFFVQSNLPSGVSFRLAQLADVTLAKETADRERKARKLTPEEAIGKAPKLTLEEAIGKARKLTLAEAISEEGLTTKTRDKLSVLTGEERIRVLRHIGVAPVSDDCYSCLLSVIQDLSPTWTREEYILEGKAFLFPVINETALFVRKCYHELYEILKDTPSYGVGALRILLTGTPGIGKSTFLIYFIVRFLYEFTVTPDFDKNPATAFQDGKDSVISSGRQMRDVLIFQPSDAFNEFYAFAGPNIVRTGTYQDFKSFFSLPTTWYLVDWKPEPKAIGGLATTLFALSPNSIEDDDFKAHEKTLWKRLCMPVWTHGELERCRQHVFPDLPKKSLDYIYDRVGGVPRSCLQVPTQALRSGLGEVRAHRRGVLRVERAFMAIKDPLKVLSLGSVKISGRLLHKVPEPKTYEDNWHYMWASAYVMNKFVDKIDGYAARNMNRQVMEGLAKGEGDGTLGRIFECYVRHLFFRGGGTTLRKRRLYEASAKGKEPESQLFTIPKELPHKPFSGMADFSIPKDDSGTLWTPGPNLPCVDLILTPDSLFQIIISPHHPVKQEPLRKILEQLPAKEKISLYFVVPDTIFQTFNLQSYLNDQGKVSKLVPGSVAKLEQWVLEVPLMRMDKADVCETKKRAANEGGMQQQAPEKKQRIE